MNKDEIIQKATKEIKECREYASRLERRWDIILYAVQRLAAVGVEPESAGVGALDPMIWVHQKDLRKVREVFGPLKCTFRYPVSEKRILVSLQARDLSGLRFMYETRMPKRTKCKIVTKVYEKPAKKYEYHSLVCPS